MNTIKTTNTPWNVIINLAMAYICYGLCRLTFILENWGLYHENLSFASLINIFKGGFVFDSSAIFYTNSLYILFVLLPLHYKETPVFHKITKWIFIIPNSICIIANLMDVAYFSLTQHRATALVFKEFENEGNIWQILGIESLRHWYLVVIAIALIFALVKFYRSSQTIEKSYPLKKYYIKQTILLIVTIPLAIGGMRGLSWSPAMRPIRIGAAHQYVNRPQEAAIVLNTPFSIIRTLTKNEINIPVFFKSHSELDSIFTPVHNPLNNVAQKKKNIVILIVESFAQEYVGSLNRTLDNGKYKGYTPFIDSLLNHSLTFEETFSNGGYSIDAMPAVLSSIQRMGNAYVLTQYSLNTINSLASELENWGYQTAFYHGADNSSMGFQAFAKSASITDYFGRTEFCQDTDFDGDNEFDGTWAIWDEPFLQYFCKGISQMKEPFLAGVFTATSHHPYRIPEKYKDVFKDEGLHKIHKCIKYTDYSLRKFFASASKQPWFKNTIFIITADHATNLTTHDIYKTELGHFRIPILFYDPSGEMPIGKKEGIAQQIDIMPTLLNYLGYDKPYIAFGQDLFNTPPSETWAFNWEGIPQFIKGDYLIQFTNNKVSCVYNYKKDPLLKHNLKGKVAVEHDMEKQAKAIMQSYMERMKADSLVIK
ncbi:MAG: sulfatase-like hydrolase/transferase [Prevotellaceae bacterium]|nr:sulfatase-like hydrolase/transferase [Prevotellaceae bacterium]